MQALKHSWLKTISDEDSDEDGTLTSRNEAVDESIIKACEYKD